MGSRSSRWRRTALVLCLLFVSVGAVSARAAEPSREPQSVSELMESNPRLSKWVKVLKELDLWESFQTSPPVTAFAPTNEALAEIPRARWRAWKRDNTEFRRFVLYHFLRGAHSGQEFRRHRSGYEETLAGVDLAVKADHKGLVVWDGTRTANVLKRESKGVNGFLFVIDGPIFPPIPRM